MVTAVVIWIGLTIEAFRYLCSGRSCVERRADLVDALGAETLIERLSQPDAAALLTPTAG